MRIDLTEKKNLAKAFGFVIVFFLCLPVSKACQCPLTTLSLEECGKYEIIFKGKIDSVVDCGNKFGEAYFKVEELYKGNATERFTVLFECYDPCFQQFQPGQEWIIYSRYKQINKAMMDWCSRSRKYFHNDKEDFYAANYGNDYIEEERFLRENLGLHRFILDDKNRSENRNTKPNTTQTVVILISSIAGLLLFYFLFNKFFR